MQFSDTTNKQGLIQSCEWWAGFSDAEISGDASLLKIFTGRLNRRLDRYLGMLGAGTRKSTIDDINFADQPFSYFAIVLGRNDYEFKEDEDGNAISDITAVLIIKSATSNEYEKLDILTLDDDDAELIMSPNASETGIPGGYIERNNTIFFDKIPNYASASGGKLFYKRSPSYFLSTDTTKEPGIPFQFHEMLAIAAAYDYILVHKSDASTLISRIEKELNDWEREFRTFCEMRNPIKRKITPKLEDTR